MPKRLRATLLHIVYSKSKKIAIVFIIFLEKSITLSLSSPLLLRISPHTFDFIPIPSMSLSSRKRSIFNAFRHILPCVAPLCEDMHYHKTGVPWQIKSTFIMQFYFLSYKFKISYIPNYLIIYFVPLPLPSIAITPFSHISFSNFVVFDFPKGIYGAISLIGFSIVLLKSL